MGKTQTGFDHKKYDLLDRLLFSIHGRCLSIAPRRPSIFETLPEPENDWYETLVDTTSSPSNAQLSASHRLSTPAINNPVYQELKAKNSEPLQQNQDGEQKHSGHDHIQEFIQPARLTRQTGHLNGVAEEKTIETAAKASPIKQETEEKYDLPIESKFRNKPANQVMHQETELEPGPMIDLNENNYKQQPNNYFNKLKPEENPVQNYTTTPSMNAEPARQHVFQSEETLQQPQLLHKFSEVPSDNRQKASSHDVKEQFLQPPITTKPSITIKIDQIDVYSTIVHPTAPRLVTRQKTHQGQTGAPSLEEFLKGQG